METEEKIRSFDLQRMLLPDEFDWTFLLEVAFRSAFMFVLVLVFLKLTGKRGVKQLSFFELAIVVGLGSAAGDPMFYKDVPLLPVIVVFVVIWALHKFITFLTRKSNTAEKILEGKPDVLLENNLLVVKNMDTDELSYDEFFAFLRIHGVEHLGQVKKIYLETSGQISIFYFPDEDVKAGLPILPELYEKGVSEIEARGTYSCTKCNYTANFSISETPECPNCSNNKWLKSFTSLRIR